MPSSHAERIGGLYLSGRLCWRVLQGNRRRAVPVRSSWSRPGDRRPPRRHALELDAGERVIVGGRSSGVTLTRRAAFALRPARALRLAPLTHRWPGSEEAATTCPPGHMQNENTLRPLGRWATKFVGGRPERWMSRRGSILGSVDVALRMLDANAHGKGLLCEGHVVVLRAQKYREQNARRRG